MLTFESRISAETNAGTFHIVPERAARYAGLVWMHTRRRGTMANDASQQGTNALLQEDVKRGEEDTLALST